MSREHDGDDLELYGSDVSDDDSEDDEWHRISRSQGRDEEEEVGSEEEELRSLAEESSE